MTKLGKFEFVAKGVFVPLGQFTLFSRPNKTTPLWSVSSLWSSLMRIKNDLSFQIGRYQSWATCFDILLTEALAEVRMSKHVTRG